MNTLEDLHLERYPSTSNKSLRPYSTAELLALEYIGGHNIEKVYLYNDRFGFWNCMLYPLQTVTVWTYASQKKAIVQNLKRNNFSTEINYFTPLDSLEKVSLVLLKVPKSLELFDLFLYQIHQAATADIEVVCCFMTKYFSKSLQQIAEKYFYETSQSKAWKKARLFILKGPKKDVASEEFKKIISFKGKEFKQYFGVFSSSNIDIGTQFLLQNFHVTQEELMVLDLASGNGVIANFVQEQNKNASVTLVDDFNLAVASSKCNVNPLNSVFICDNSLSSFNKEHFDLIVSNPPFHFEHENNIEVTLHLFQEVFYCLKDTGRFVVVCNNHLNYATHLSKIFPSVILHAKNTKFSVYECVKLG
ncbi:methyltransferase [Tenacibaculum sp. SG-28]|uniref:class I SAM-dependent methyltransferase n=1 Tax=Tenacibaculum sp. SG-28 TaxID=754426 RepID=UPI000CF4AC85|nr:methyltransferase [Tenacibaculum sp. SG-28]PQJ22993.1 hypothetical protein BSU00_01580 [Tenacibaculum sp. SG-28]